MERIRLLKEMGRTPSQNSFATLSEWVKNIL